jgi:hypothetical protein
MPDVFRCAGSSAESQYQYPVVQGRPYDFAMTMCKPHATLCHNSDSCGHLWTPTKHEDHLPAALLTASASMGPAPSGIMHDAP